MRSWMFFYMIWILPLLIAIPFANSSQETVTIPSEYQIYYQAEQNEKEVNRSPAIIGPATDEPVEFDAVEESAENTYK